MITNRDEVLENAFRVFATMNYERASFTEIAKACGLSRAGIVHYYPYKQDLFIAVADRYFFNAHRPENKFATTGGTLAEFIDCYIHGIDTTMEWITKHVCDKSDTGTKCPNFYYFHFIMQVYLYYPDAKRKFATVNERNRQLWRTVIARAKDAGEIRNDIDTDSTATIFHHIYIGRSYEEAHLQGLDTKALRRNLLYLYSLLRP